MATDKVQVAVRVRPVNRREQELATKCVIAMEQNQTILYHPKDSPLDIGGNVVASQDGDHSGRRNKAPKSFAFDHCFWSMDKDNPRFSSQQHVFQSLGEPLLERSFEGYNGCIFAYGQTGSGKSYTMMGCNEDGGIIPRLCDALFDRIAKLEDETKVEVSYMEIYNEKVHDLLDLKGHKTNLKVREHNILGPYVDGLSMLVVTSFEDINNLMSEGNKSRTVAATNMNSESSRSHAVFNIIVTQSLTDQRTSVSGEKVSKISLVDLAGSERAQKTGAMGDRLREGSNINKSLTTLGLVISALADQGSKSKNKFVPYRDSVLTWLLKDNLGGNSKTIMVATISPSADNYEETLSTLRYADRAKRIVNHAVVNEDPNARIIRELRDEVDLLQKELKEAQSMKAPDLKEKLEESEKLLKDMRKTWEEKLQETEKIQTERHQALEEMGVSVEASGIKVQHSRYFLVNLNADPSLNELLVYYLKEHTLVGCPNEETKPDIQLSGLGIQPEHCLVTIDENEVIVSPVEGARTCVNGSVIHERTKAKHGDRILWGNNHFFRINCPITNSPSTTSPDADQTIDYNFAQQELMMKEFSNDPISEAIKTVEKQYEEDKQEALEQQRKMYERQMQMLRYQLMSPGTPSMPFPPMDMSKLTPTGSQSGIQRKYQQWAQERDKMFKQSLSHLKEDVVKANSLVREANFLAQEMGKQTEFHVTLQIPASNLSPNRRRGAFVCEPAILVRRKHRCSQVWSMEKFENKIIDMREMHEDRKSQGIPLMVDDSDESESDEGPPQRGDPFYESCENHNLIGVANVFLDCLFYDVKLDYHVPIISQQGEVAGKLHVEISKLGGNIMDRYADIHLEDDSDEESSVPVGVPLIIRVKIHEAKGLPKDLSNFVFCQYTFWGHDEPISVPPEIIPDAATDRKCSRFNHERDFKVYMSEEFIEHAQEGALSIEVWGHKVVGFGQQLSQIDSLARCNSLVDRWHEVTRKIEVWMEILEVNDQGEYVPVEVKPQAEVPAAGFFQLRQGHARRILVRIKPQADSGTLPLICDSISSVSIGCICARSKLQKGLDSYQEEDLNRLRERWSDALSRRHRYLDSQIKGLMNKQDKTEADSDRERALIDQWVSLTEERNAVLVPAAGSGIPGAPADWEAPTDMEQHRPVLFLDLNSDDMTTPSVKEGTQAAGINSILPKEQTANYVGLPILKSYPEKESICAISSWDSSIHDSPHLNRLTGANDRVYLILKVVLRLSHPAYMELVVRKRVCVNVKHRNMSLTDKLRKRLIGTDNLHASGVTYDVVSNIPKASEDLEDMETLAQMAAQQNEVSAADGETYIEKYIKGVSAVESILTLDRLRQEVTVKELMAAQGRSLRKATSVPNIHQFVTTPPRMDEKMRFESIQDLTCGDVKGSSAPARPSFLDLRLPTLTGTPKSTIMSPMSGKLGTTLQTLQEEQNHREQHPLLDSEEEDDYSPAKVQPPTTLLDQSATLNTSQSSLKSIESKQELLDNKQDLMSLKNDLAKLKKSFIEPDPASIESDDFQDFESYESQQVNKVADVEGHTEGGKVSRISHSGTSDSIADGKSSTPSMASSGYGSQAVSTLTLSSEDSLSLRSNDDSESSKLARKSGLEHTSSGESDGDENSNHSGAIPEHIEEEDTEDMVDTEEAEELKEFESEKSSSNETLENVSTEKLAESVKVTDQASDSDSLKVADHASDLDNLKVADQASNTESLKVTDQASDVGTDVEKISLKSDYSDDDDDELPASNKLNNLHISEEDLSSDNKKDSEQIKDKVIAENNGSEKSENKSVDSHSDSHNKESEDVAVKAKKENSGLEVTRRSDSSSNASRGPIHSDSIDPYSLEAMEELERLGDEFGNDNSEFTGISFNESVSVIETQNKINSKVKATPDKMDFDSNAKGLNDSLSKCDMDIKPEFQSTPKKPEGRLRGVGSEPRARPVSCIISSQNDLLNSSLQDQNKRNSLDFSEEQPMDDSMSVCSFGSRADLDRLSEVPVPAWVQVGESVMVTSSKSSAKMTGVVQFVGNVEFAHGPWVGVELDLPEGKNSGSVNGIQYFKCRHKHGIFVRHDKLILDKKRRGSRKSAAKMMGRQSVGHSPASSGASKATVGHHKK